MPVVFLLLATIALLSQPARAQTAEPVVSQCTAISQLVPQLFDAVAASDNATAVEIDAEIKQHLPSKRALDRYTVALGTAQELHGALTNRELATLIANECSE